jgi:hypothetical protein
MSWRSSTSQLQAVKTLAVLPQNDELLDDTIQRIDQALNTTAGV